MSTITEILFFLLSHDYTLEPQCDVSELGNYVYIEMEITDLDLNHLSINIIDGSKVEILGTKKRKASQEAIYLRAERVFGNFKKKMELPFRIERVKDINYKNGLLKITLVKR